MSHATEKTRGLRFLLIEDDPDQAELMSAVLCDAFTDCEVRVARSGAEFDALPPSGFDLGIFDLHLPDCTGLDLLDRVRRVSDLPVIMVTGERFGRVAADAIRRGAIDYVVKHGDYLDVVPVVIEKALAMVEMKAVNRRLENELLERNAQLERLNEQLRELASHDPLTGLFNRRHFEDLLDQLFPEARRYEAHLTCIMLDVDCFKRINDTLGHPVGDRVLQLTADVLRRTLRQADVPARYGGDEFVVLLPRTASAEAQSSARRIIRAFRLELARRLPRVTGVTLSIGLASVELGQPTTGEALVRLADQALYLAKAAGKDQIMIVNPVKVASAV